MLTQFILFLILQVLDLATTVFVIAHGGYEGNPIVRWLLQDFKSFTFGLVCLKLFAVMVGTYAYARNGRLFFRLTNPVFVLVVAWNLAGVIGILAHLSGAIGHP